MNLRPLAIGTVALLFTCTASSALAGEAEATPDRSVPLVDFPGFNPVDRQVQEAVSHVSAIADQLQLAVRGKIDPAIAAQRIREIKATLLAVRATWTEQKPDDRIAARERLAAAIAQAGARLAAATTAFEQWEQPDHRVWQALSAPPAWKDFLREPPYQTFRGVFRSGFETSHFFPLEGSGTMWADTAPDAWEQLQRHLVMRPGRGSRVLVAITFQGYREDEGGYGHASNYGSLVFIERIEAIRPLSDEEFELIRLQTR